MLRNEMFETFLDLAIESREVILPLGSSNSDAKSLLRLDSMRLIEREMARVFVMC